jgi:hypothetical protein
VPVLCLPQVRAVRVMTDAETIQCLFTDVDNLKLSDNVAECEQEVAALKDTKPAKKKSVHWA